MEARNRIDGVGIQPQLTTALAELFQMDRSDLIRAIQSAQGIKRGLRPSCLQITPEHNVQGLFVYMRCASFAAIPARSSCVLEAMRSKNPVRISVS